MHDDVVGQLLDSAATRLAAYGYLLTGSQVAGDELVQAAIVQVSVRHRRLRDVRALEGRVRASHANDSSGRDTQSRLVAGAAPEVWRSR